MLKYFSFTLKESLAKLLAMTKIDAHATRLENLRRLAAALGGPTQLSYKLGYANGSYLAQLAGPNPTRPVGEKVARDIEAKLGLPAGWMDQEDAPMIFNEAGGKQTRVKMLRDTVEKNTTYPSTHVPQDRMLRPTSLDQGPRALDLGPESTNDETSTAPQREFTYAGEYKPGPHDLPVYGSFKGSFDGNDIDYQNPVEYIQRPAELVGVREAFGIYFINDSMEPRYFQGEMGLVHPGQPVRVGDHVAVVLKNDQGLVKKLVKKTDDYVILAQYNPPQERKFKRSDIVGIYKIIGSRS
jgi:phage repressor protein C with HTH and peptisase S24 domain